MQFKLEQAVEILSQTPATLRSLLNNLSEDWTHGGDRDNWSAYDVVGHLVQGEKDLWIPRIKIVLAQGENPAFEPFDRYAHFENSKGKILRELLDDFEAARGESLMRLEALDITPEKLSLKCMHPDLGEIDLEKLLSTWAVHDLTHTRQIIIFMAKKYADNVGPWKQYLSVLK
jgi:hypothetical protein